MEARIWLSTDSGIKLALLDNVASYRYVKAINGVGSFYIYYSAGTIDPSFMTPDRIVQFWTHMHHPAVPEGFHQLDYVGFTRTWGWQTDDQGVTLGRMSGHDPNGLLERRIVAYPAGHANTKITGSVKADDGMKDVFYTNFMGGAVAGRNINNLNISVEPDKGEGPDIDKAFAWRRVLDVLMDLNEASRASDNEVFFAIEPFAIMDGQPIGLEFRTWTGQPGTDRTWGNCDDPIIVGLDYGNLEAPDLEYDHRNIENYVYAGGQGEEADRNIQEVQNTDSLYASLYNRCEGFAHATNETTDDGVAGVGLARLGRYRPVTRFKGYLLSTEQAPYGAWFLGDKVTVIYQGKQIDGVIRRVEVNGEAGRGTVARGYIEEII